LKVVRTDADCSIILVRLRSPSYVLVRGVLHRKCELWPFDYNIWSTHLCPTKTYQVTTLTMFEKEDPADTWT